MQLHLKQITISRRPDRLKLFTEYHIEPAAFWFLKRTGTQLRFISVYCSLDEVRRFMNENRNRIKAIKKTDRESVIDIK